MTKIVYEDVKPYIEGLKEMARVLLLGILPVLLSSINTQTGEILINWGVVKATGIAVLLTASLRGLDKDLHLTGKIEKDETKTKGLTQF